MAVAWVLKRFAAAGRAYRPLMLELPRVPLAALRNLAIGLWERVKIFVRRVGTIILALMIVLWFLASYPAPPPGADGPGDRVQLCRACSARARSMLFAPIGFNWQISHRAGAGAGGARSRGRRARHRVFVVRDRRRRRRDARADDRARLELWRPAWSLLAWYVFAPQCLSTLATVRRETGGWTWPMVMAAYLFGLAYLAAFVVYHAALSFGGA